MPLATTTVNGTITLPDGGGISAAIIAFSLVRFQTVSPYVIPTANKTANIAANGDFTVELAPNDPTQAPTYLVTLTVYNSSGAQVHFEKLGYIAVPAIGPVELADLIVLDPPESTQADALAQAIAAAAAAAGQAVLAQGYADDAELSAIDAADSAAAAALYSTPYLDDIPAVLADTSLAYGAGAGQVQVGDFVRTKAEGYALEVAAAGAVDHDIETAGGVKFYVRPFPCAFETRAAFLAAIAAGYVWADGTVVTAGNQSYRKDGSTDIIDIPGWTWRGEETFRHHGGDYGDPDQPTRVTIRHMRDGTYVYDVIEIRNPRPHTLRKEPGDNFDPLDGTQDIAELRTVAAERGHQIVANCDASFNVGGRYVSSGLQIVDGVAIQDFEDSEYRREAAIMYRDGRLRAGRLSDGMSAQDYVDDGAVWSAGWGWLLVVDGVGQTPTGTLATTVSARSVIGQRANGDLVIIQVEGKTGDYGITGADLVTLCLSENLYFAMNLDGGGSTQCWWKTAYSMPSSDSSPRTLAGYLVVSAPSIPDFDTGNISIPPAAGVTGSVLVRQVGETVDISLNNGGTFPLETYTALTSSLPKRFFPADIANARRAGSGGGYNLVQLGMPSPLTGQIFARPKQAAETLVLGQITYRARWSSASPLPL